MTKRDFIRQKCVEANPEKEWKPQCIDCFIVRFEPIRLADVLLAIDEATKAKMTKPIYVNAAGYFVLSGIRSTNSAWNLREDSLDKQDQGTVDFIHSLLAP